MREVFLLLSLLLPLIVGCSSSQPAAPVAARTVTGDPVLLRPDHTWIHDVEAMASPSSNAVVICGWTPSEEFEGILNNHRLVGEGLEMGIPVHLARTVDVPGAVWNQTSGILLRGDIPAGVHRELLNQIAAGRRAVVFLNEQTLDDDSRSSLLEALDLALLRTAPYHRIDGSAVAYFCAGLEVDLGSYWHGKEWEIYGETELKLGSEWSRTGVVDGRIYSAYRPWGHGELIISSVGASPYTMVRSTPVDDGPIERGDNEEVARRLLRWLSEGNAGGTSEGP